MVPLSFLPPCVAQECVRALVDSFAADVNAKDNAGRTPMATLVSRHRAHRPGVGPHAAKKLAVIDDMMARRTEMEEEERERERAQWGMVGGAGAGGIDVSLLDADSVESGGFPMSPIVTKRMGGDGDSTMSSPSAGLGMSSTSSLGNLLAVRGWHVCY